MKLIIGIVNEEDAHRLEKKLVEQQIGVTKLASTGGFLRSGNTTFLSGVKDSQVDQTLAIYENTCSKRKIQQTMAPASPMDFSVDFALNQSIEVEVGGCVVFVLDIEQFFKV